MMFAGQKPWDSGSTGTFLCLVNITSLLGVKKYASGHDHWVESRIRVNPNRKGAGHGLIRCWNGSQQLGPLPGLHFTPNG